MYIIITMKKQLFLDIMIIILMIILCVLLTKEKIVKTSQMEIIYNGDRNNKTIYLTFDDGFSKENTEEIIRILKHQNIPATFFFYGEFMKYYPKLINNILNDGFIIGNHTMNHKNITKLTKKEIKKELTSWEELYKQITLTMPPLIFRPPQGGINRESYEIVKSLGYNIIKWDVQIYDYDIYNDKGTNYVITNILKQTKNGSIILMHTMTKSNVNALETIIDELLKKGYQFGNILDLISTKI